MIGREEGATTMANMPFNERLKELRGEAGMTQEAVARAAGLSTSTIAKLEHAGVDPSWSTVVLIAKAIGVGVNAFENDAPGEPPTDAPKKGPGRPKKASAVAAVANVEDAVGEAPRAKRGAAKGKAKRGNKGV
jgi:transcriptional regulator with XRE-family HTH domain